MPAALSGPKLEAFKNLRLDNEFFEKALQRVDENAGGSDFDLYLMEKSVMPLLLQGLEALARHVDKQTTRPTNRSQGKIIPFNPLTWLAQYMLRNHPKMVNDHRTAVYSHFTELALAERGRRTLMRRRAQMEEMWVSMEKEFKVAHREQRQMVVEDIPEFISRLDKKWGLEGMFQKKLPQLPTDYTEALREGLDHLTFNDFWQWFELYISENDVVRAADFMEAEQRVVDAMRKAKQMQEERARRERTIAEVHELRRSLEEQFDTLSADIYINDTLGLILNKSCFLELPDPDDTRVREGNVPPLGEHATLLLYMLQLWGCEVPESAPDDQWSDAAVEAWLQWQQINGPQGAPKSKRLDATGLRAMLNRDSYQTYLLSSNQINFDTEMLNIVNHMVEIRNVLGETEDTLDFLVEALDEETGELLQLSLPESEIEEVRRRLAEAGAEPVMARVDLVSSRVKRLVDPETEERL